MLYLEGSIVCASREDANYYIAIADHWVVCANYAQACRVWDTLYARGE